MRKITCLILLGISIITTNLVAQLEIYQCYNSIDFQNDGTTDRYVSSSVLYDKFNQLIQRLDSIDSDADGQIDQLQTCNFSYDPNGNNIAKYYFNDSNNDGQTDRFSTTIYTYENTYLAEEIYSSNNSYRYVKSNVYDNLYNLISTTYSIDFDNDGSINQTQVFLYENDLIGNRIQTAIQVDNNNDGTIDYLETYNYLYNSANQLIASEGYVDFDNDGTINHSSITSNFYNSNSSIDSIIIEHYAGQFEYLQSRNMTINKYLSTTQIEQTLLLEDSDANGSINYFESTNYRYNTSDILIQSEHLIDYENDGTIDYREENIFCLFDGEIPDVTFCPRDTIIQAEAGNCTAVVVYSNPIFSDNVDGNDLSGIIISGDTSGAIFDVGTSVISYEYTDAYGNGPVQCSFSITVIDQEPPVISNCPNDIVTCNLNFSLQDLSTVLVSDNCGISRIDTVYFPNADFLPGTTTQISYTYFDNAGNSKSCSFSVDVLDGEEPQIISTPIPFGCQGNAVLNALPNGASYLWSNGSTDQSIIALSPGIYQVMITDINGCMRIATDTIFTDYEAMSTMISNYTLLAENDISLNESEVYGGVGSAGIGDKITLDNNSNVWGFTKSQELDIKNSSSINGLTISPFFGNPIQEPVPFLLPEVPVHPFQLAIKYDIKVRKNKTLILDGNNCSYILSQNCSYFNNLTLDRNSKLIIRNLPTIRFNKITTRTGSQIIFEQNTDLYAADNVTIDENNYFGPDPGLIDQMSINFFVQNQLQVDKGTEFVANAIAGDIHIKDATETQRTVMMGYYISKDKIESDKFITWNTNSECGIPFAPLHQVPQLALAQKVSNNEITIDTMYLDVSPNPARYSTNIRLNKVISNGTIEIYHHSGILIDSYSISNTDHLNVSLNTFSNGMYFVHLKSTFGTATKRLMIIN